jgi:lysozyme
MKLILDISHWESVTDWEKVATQVDGIYLKATQRHNWTDPTFSPYRFGAKSVGLPWGAYHFWEESTAGVVQAKYMLKVLNGDYGQLPPCLDYEPKYIGQNPPRVGALSSIQSFLLYVEQETGMRPLFYTNWDHIKSLSPIPQWLLEYDLWIASYSAKEPVITPWKEWTLWQFTDAGCIEGINDAVDMNKAKDDFVGHVTQPELTLEEKVEKLWNDHYKVFPC